MIGEGSADISATTVSGEITLDKNEIVLLGVASLSKQEGILYSNPLLLFPFARQLSPWQRSQKNATRQ